MTARWWALHIAPQSRRDLGNIDVRNWRPRPAALIVGLALLIAVTLIAPIVVEWLTTWLPSGPARYVGWFFCLTAVFAYVSTRSSEVSSYDRASLSSTASNLTATPYTASVRHQP